MTLIAEISGFVAAVLVFMTFYMKTMIPLRIVGIASNCAFILYGYLAHLHPVLVLHLVLLPLNCLRLWQMIRLTTQVQEAVQGDHGMDWVKPFTAQRQAKAGEILFRAGDVADDMFVVVSGLFRLVEGGIDVVPGQVVGEFAWVAPERRRTQTLECLEAGTLLRLDYHQVEQLFFQNPRFGFYLLKLITARLFENVTQLQGRMARLRATAPE